jgi:hypothetical protein
MKLDGVPVAGVTPLTVTDLAAGEHLLEISKGDYGYTGKVMVRADDYVTLSLPLKKAEVQLEVLSDPPEATILLNGMEMGRTPKIFSAVKVGEHVIELRRDGFLLERQAIRLGAGNPRQSVRVSLRPAAVLLVDSTPSVADVRVDGSRVGTTPVTVSVAPGEHRVELALDGHTTVRKMVRAEGGQRVRLDVQLQLDSAQRKRLAALQAVQRSHAEVELRHREAVRAHELRCAPKIQQRRRRSIWGYITLSAGAALIATGAILCGVGASQGGDAHDAYMGEADTAPPSDLAALDQHRADIESARGKVAAGGVLLGLGVAATGFAIYQLATRPTVPDQPATTANRPLVGLAPTAHGALLVLSGAM